MNTQGLKGLKEAEAVLEGLQSLKGNIHSVAQNSHTISPAMHGMLRQVDSKVIRLIEAQRRLIQELKGSL